MNNGTITGTTNVYYGATVQGTGNFGQINVFEGGTLAVSLAAGPLASSLILSGGSISGTGQLTQSATILNSAALVVAGPTAQLVLSGDLSGDGSVTALGDGTIILAGDNSYTGNTIANTGTLILDSSAAVTAGTSLIVGTGGTLDFDPSVVASPLAASPDLAVAAVPEPGVLALLAQAAACLPRGRCGENVRIGLPRLGRLQ